MLTMTDWPQFRGEEETVTLLTIQEGAVAWLIRDKVSYNHVELSGVTKQGQF